MQKSFINVSPKSHFPIQNLPYGVFRTTNRSPRIGVAIGDFVLDLAVLADASYFKSIESLPDGVFKKYSLNAFMSLGRPTWKAVRVRLIEILSAENRELQDDESTLSEALIKRDEVTMLLPAQIGDYTDFYASLEHATNVGTMFRGADNALNPNWKHLPVGYHGRSSSITAGNGNIRRPSGQIAPSDHPTPRLSPTQKLDLELETAFFVGPGNTHGTPIPIESAENHIFGMVLLNDWSARDIQKWEYVPLGPFLGKSFHSTISPWVVTLDALEPFRTNQPPQSPPTLSYLTPQHPSAYNIQLEVTLKTENMSAPDTICRTNFKFLYWSMVQQLAHHTINGCNMRSGDLLGSGTISGPSPASLGSLLEITWNGERPLKLSNGELRRFLEDGDIVKLSGYAQGDGYRVGFGELVNTVTS